MWLDYNWHVCLSQNCWKFTFSQTSNVWVQRSLESAEAEPNKSIWNVAFKLKMAEPSVSAESSWGDSSLSDAMSAEVWAMKAVEMSADSHVGPEAAFCLSRWTDLCLWLLTRILLLQMRTGVQQLRQEECNTLYTDAKRLLWWSWLCFTPSSNKSLISY